MAESIIKYIEKEINFKYKCSAEQRFSKKEFIEKINNMLSEDI